MYYHADFLVMVNHDDMEFISNLIVNTLPNVERVLISSLVVSHNQVFIDKNTLYDPNDVAGEFKPYEYEIEFIYMAEESVTKDDMKEQANIANLLASALTENDIKFLIIGDDLSKFLDI